MLISIYSLIVNAFCFSFHGPHGHVFPALGCVRRLAGLKLASASSATNADVAFRSLVSITLISGIAQCISGRDWKGVVCEAVEGAGVFCWHSRDNSLTMRFYYSEDPTLSNSFTRWLVWLLAPKLHT